MTLKRTVLVLAVAAAFFVPAGSALADCGFSNLNGVALMPTAAQSALTALNDARLANGLTAWRAVPTLTEAAMHRAEMLAQHKTTISDDAAMGANLSDCGVTNFLRESDESNYQSVNDAVKSWLTHADSRPLVFDTRGSTVGIGVAKATDGTLYWVVIVGFPSDESGDPYAGIPTSTTGSTPAPAPKQAVLSARADHRVVKAGHTILINVLANDRHSAADQNLVVRKVTKPAHGRASVFNYQQVRYTAPVGFHGTVKLRYQIARDGKKAWGVITITVR